MRSCMLPLSINTSLNHLIILLIEISGPFVADKAVVLPCSLDDNAEQGSCGSREKFSVLLQVVNGFET